MGTKLKFLVGLCGALLFAPFSTEARMPRPASTEVTAHKAVASTTTRAGRPAYTTRVREWESYAEDDIPAELEDSAFTYSLHASLNSFAPCNSATECESLWNACNRVQRRYLDGKLRGFLVDYHVKHRREDPARIEALSDAELVEEFDYEAGDDKKIAPVGHMEVARLWREMNGLKRQLRRARGAVARAKKKKKKKPSGTGDVPRRAAASGSGDATRRTAATAAPPPTRCPLPRRCPPPPPT